MTLRQIIQKAILDALAQTGGNKTKAAQLLGITRQTLRDRLRKK